MCGTEPTNHRSSPILPVRFVCSEIRYCKKLPAETHIFTLRILENAVPSANSLVGSEGEPSLVPGPDGGCFRRLSVCRCANCTLISICRVQHGLGCVQTKVFEDPLKCTFQLLADACRNLIHFLQSLC
jgi:hypothetical protein